MKAAEEVSGTGGCGGIEMGRSRERAVEVEEEEVAREVDFRRGEPARGFDETEREEGEGAVVEVGGGLSVDESREEEREEEVALSLPALAAAEESECDPRFDGRSSSPSSSSEEEYHRSVFSLPLDPPADFEEAVFFFFAGGGEADLDSALFFRFSFSRVDVDASLPFPPRSRDDDDPALELAAASAFRTVVVTVLSFFASPPRAGDPGVAFVVVVDDSSALRFLSQETAEEEASSSSLDRLFPFLLVVGTSDDFPLLVGALVPAPETAALSVAVDTFACTRSSFRFSFLSVSLPFSMPPPPGRTTGFDACSFSLAAAAASSGRGRDSGEVTLAPEERDVRPVPPVVFVRRVEAFEDVDELEDVEDWREGI